jgi:hypothetical protein
MGFLMRTIARAGREFQWSKRTVKEEATDVVKHEELVEGGENDVRLESYALDTLCLALGLLTNLVQIVEEAKDVVRETSACFLPL